MPFYINTEKKSSQGLWQVGAGPGRDVEVAWNRGPRSIQLSPQNYFFQIWGEWPGCILKAPPTLRNGAVPSLQGSTRNLIQNVLSTFVFVRDSTLRGPVLGDHRGNKLSELHQRTAGGAAGQREGIWLVVRLVPIVHLYEVLPGGGK